MSEDARLDYDLEGLWGEGGEMDEARVGVDAVPGEDKVFVEGAVPATTKSALRRLAGRTNRTCDDEVLTRRGKKTAQEPEFEWDERPAGPAERRRASG